MIHYAVVDLCNHLKVYAEAIKHRHEQRDMFFLDFFGRLRDEAEELLAGQAVTCCQFYFFLRRAAQQLQRIDIMYEGQLSTFQEEAETDIYEDLSHLIRTFKRILDLSSQIVDQLEQEEVSIKLINQLKQIPTTYNQLITYYNYPLESTTPHKNTIYRFICRLFETISAYKAHPCRKSQVSALFKQFLAKAEQCINSYQTDKSVGRIFTKIFKYTDKFCLSCEIILNQGYRDEILTFFSKNEDFNKEDDEHSSEAKSRKLHPSKTQSNFHKTLNALNKRYNTLAFNCLDLDYNSFKGYYFQSKNQKQDIYKEFFQRNALIWREISQYSKQFSQYLKKKERVVVNRKNRLREKMERIESPTKYESEAKIRLEKKRTLENSTIEDLQKEFKDSQLPTLTRKGFKEQTENKVQNMSPLQNNSIRDGQNRKTQYQLKNVYLTLNKINASSISGIVEKGSSQPTPKKSFKQKLNRSGVHKVTKISIKATKFNEIDKFKQKPLLDIRHIDQKDFGFTIDGCLGRQKNKNAFRTQETQILKPNKQQYSKKSISQKKNIRITQLLNKSSINTKIHAEMLNAEDIIYEIRTGNCDGDEPLKI